MPTCPSCGSEDVRRAHRRSWVRALDPITPWRPWRCRACRRRFQQLKVSREATLALLGALLVIPLTLYFFVQMGLWGAGYVYWSASPFEALSATSQHLECPRCHSDMITPSIHQPKHRSVHLMNPLKPYRCLRCWRRFWILRKPADAAWRVLLAALFFGFWLHASTTYVWSRRRRRRR